MPFNTLTVSAAITPTVVATYVSHFLQRKPLHQKPTAHIRYHEGLRLIRSFLEHASQHTVEEIQAFTSQWVPCPAWVRVDRVEIPLKYITEAAALLSAQLGPEGVRLVGGTQWWQWRRENSALSAEWIEMRSDHNDRVRRKKKGRRVMLYVHGGAYFFGSVDEHRYQLQRHARKLRARVFAPRYRLAPQFPFPCGLHDCLSAYLYLLSIQEPSEIILAGDSAGGGMVVSLLVILRDQGLPLPAGAVLISPWVDLTHSFPSVAQISPLDYIPAHGFMHRPSMSWPPCPDNEAYSPAGRDRIEGHKKEQNDDAVPSGPPDGGPSLFTQQSHRSGQGGLPSLVIDGKLVVLREQMQLYATNHLISHPLVSTILQPSLGGLPPLLILTGGGEVLRDEQIYLAHKAADPHGYPASGPYHKLYDPEDKILEKYPPTPVQLQVWEDLCHVAPTLSFTRPAKYMYRSIAQFGAWALARAQRRPIEITDDDDCSIISSGSEPDVALPPIAEEANTETNAGLQHIGKAGDLLPSFKNHMIRQQVDRHGNISPLKPASELPALQMLSAEIGVVKEGPVRRWLAARDEWDKKYASHREKVQKRRVKDFADGGYIALERGENPPPSALAGRRRKGRQEVEMKAKRSWGMSLWSLWGSKHDESTMKRESEMLENETDELTPKTTTTEPPGEDSLQHAPSPLVQPSRPRTSSTASKSKPTSRPPTRPRRKSRTKSTASTTSIPAIDASSPASPARRRRTTIVSDQGQADLTDLRQQYANRPLSPHSPRATDYFALAAAPRPVPRALLAVAGENEVRRPSGAKTDGGSTFTGDGVESVHNASTRAVFGAAGVLRPGMGQRDDLDGKDEDDKGHLSNSSQSHPTTEPTTTTPGHKEIVPSFPPTPVSTASRERLHDNQLQNFTQNRESEPEPGPEPDHSLGGSGRI